MLTKKLNESDSTIVHLKSEVSNLKLLVEHLSTENHELKTRLSQTHNETVKSNGDDDSLVSNSNTVHETLFLFVVL